MPYTCFNLEVADEVAHIQLNRPDKRNSMCREFWNEIPEAVNELSHGAKVRAIVFSSTGKHFSSGIDLNLLNELDFEKLNPGSEPARRRESFRSFVLMMQAAFHCMTEARIPVLAAIQGGCIGGAVDMITACDMRYCTADAFFIIEEINIGITADVGTFPRLCHLLPDAIVRELSFTGRRLTAEEAKFHGFVNDVFDTHEQVVTHTLEVAREIAKKSPLAVSGTKQVINYARDHSIVDSLEYVATWQAAMFDTSDPAESVKARTEKRNPAYQNLLPTWRKL